MMTNLAFSSGDLAELLFAGMLIALGLFLMTRRTSQLSQTYREIAALAERARHAAEMLQAAAEPCTHPAWRVDRLAYTGNGQALKISCVRCSAPALDRFASAALADGTISIVNHTTSVQRVVIAGVLHEMLPPAEWSSYEDDEHESTYAVYLDPPEDTGTAYLRKL
jgi:hypothetical protein